MILSRSLDPRPVEDQTGQTDERRHIMSKRRNNNSNNNRNNSNRGQSNNNNSQNRGSQSRSGNVNANKDHKYQMVPAEDGSNMPHVVTDSKASNDASWYTHIYALAKDVASLALNLPVGPYQYSVESAPINYPSEWGDDEIHLTKTISRSALTVPGIMTIRLAPALGTCTSATAAANVAAQQLYTLVRKANSGAINYDKTDLMRMIIAMDSAYMVYEYLLRIYRTFGVYNYMNRYMPDSLLRAEGAMPVLVDQLADFRALLDNFAYQLGSINVPDQFDFIRRHSWLFSHVYKDADTDKAQLYLFQPDGFYMWVEGQESKPSYLKYIKTEELFQVASGGGIAAVTQMRVAIDKIMRPLLGSQDVGTMCGDLAKAFGEGGMIKIRPVADHEALVPVYDMEVISQMANAVIFEESDLIRKTMDIESSYSSLVDGPILVQQPVFEASAGAHATHKHLFNMQHQDVTPEEVMVATRLMTTLDTPVILGNNTNGFPAKSWGTEIAVGMSIYTLTHVDPGTTWDGLTVLKVPQNMSVANSASSALISVNSNYHNLIEIIVALAKFDNHPTVYFLEGGTEADVHILGGTYQYAGELQDINCFIWLEDSKIADFNDVAIMSEFAAKDYNTGV
nr:putative capsid [Marmot picobirnavirus]